MENRLKKIINNRHTIIFLTLILIIMVAITGTYAWFTWNSEENTELTMTIGSMADVMFTTGNDITTGLTPVFSYSSGEKTNFTINNYDNTGGMLLYTITLNITTIPEVLRSNQVKYALVKNNKLIREGDLNAAVDGSSIEIYTNNLVPGTTEFDFYIYIDGNEENDRNMIGTTLVGNIMVEGNEYTPSTIATFISDLYTTSDKTVVTNNNIEYNNANAVVLMNDRLGGTTDDYNAGNIRYYGPYVENYVYFNCNDYDNPSAATCEKWRIIGNFDGMTKILRDEVIGNYSWDTSASSVNSGMGISDWNNADLMKLLNPGYETNQDLDTDGNTITVNNSLYWNGSSEGTCYVGNDNSTSTCDFSSIGLKNDKTRNMIVETTWYLGLFDNNTKYPDHYYSMERSDTLCSDCNYETTWKGEIALMYPSDFAYAVDFSKCNQNVMYNSVNSTGKKCIENNWLAQFEFGTIRLLSPQTKSKVAAISHFILSNNHIVYFHNTYTLGATGTMYIHTKPTLHLNPQTMISGGDGSYENPYIIYRDELS